MTLNLIARQAKHRRGADKIYDDLIVIFATVAFTWDANGSSVYREKQWEKKK